MHAQLAWDRKDCFIAAKGSDTSAVGIFKFHNAGRTPIHIVSVASDCGCTTSTPDKANYLPGEPGEIKAVFNFGIRTGVQQKWIAVRTDQAVDSVTLLKLVVDVPEVLRVNPTVIYWQGSDKRMARQIDVTIPAGSAAEDFNILCADKRFTFHREMKVQGREYAVSVVPPATGAPISVQALIVPVPKLNRLKTVVILLLVR